jgi:hypothetical protein
VPTAGSFRRSGQRVAGRGSRPAPQEDTAEPSSSLNLTEGLTKAAGALAIISYASGLVVVNAYLLPYGVSDFNLFRARFVLTGLLVVATLVVATGSPLAGFLLARSAVRGFPKPLLKVGREPRKRSRVAAWFLRIDCAFIAVLFFVAPPVIFVMAFGQTLLGSALLYLFAGVTGGILLLAVAYAQGRLKRAEESRTGWPDQNGDDSRLPRWIFYGLLSFFLFPYLYFLATRFAQEVYPRIPEQMGGGRPQIAQFLVKHDSVAGLSELGVPMSESDSDTTAVLFLLFRGENYYLVQEEATREVFVLQADIVSGLRTG